MKKFIVSSIFLALAILPFLVGCQQSSSSQFKQKVGKEIYAVLANPGHVKLEGQRTLTQPEIQGLQAYLLNDEGYIFDRTKKCLFIPQQTITFEGKDQVVVMVSFTCKQVKFIRGDQTVILDTDPMAKEFEDHIHKELIK